MSSSCNEDDVPTVTTSSVGGDEGLSYDNSEDSKTRTSQQNDDISEDGNGDIIDDSLKKMANEYANEHAHEDLDLDDSVRSDFYHLSADEDEGQSVTNSLGDSNSLSNSNDQSMGIDIPDVRNNALARQESSQSDIDPGSASYSADNESSSMKKVSRRRSQGQQQKIPENSIKESFSPRSSSESPPELRTFPAHPFSQDREWNANSEHFPSSYDSNHGASDNFSAYQQAYGALNSTSWNVDTNSFSQLATEKSDGITSASPLASTSTSTSTSANNHNNFFSMPLSPPQSPHSISKSYDDNYDCSSSERTPILSNYTRSGADYEYMSHPPKSPKSFQTIDEENCLVVKDELWSGGIKSPARKFQKSQMSPRPESLFKVMKRQKSISMMMGNLKGKKQPTSCRDVGFAIVYIIQLLIIICLGLRFGPEAFGLGEEDDVYALDRKVGIHFAYADVLIIAFISGLVSIGISAVTFTFMAIFTDQWIKMALRLATFLSILLTATGLVQSPLTFVPLMGLLTIGLTIAYAFIVWDEIPFVSANLYTALTACRSTIAILGIAIVVQVFALVWIVIYFFTCIGVHNYFQENDDVDIKWRIWAFIGLGLSFNWTIQAMMNMMEVCIAGYINRWWSQPTLQDSQKLDAVGESLIRALVYSFGSVCFGSMFIGLVNALRGIADQIRPYREEAPIALLVVVQEFIVSCIDLAASIFNEYAMINIGMYGYDFLEAGKQANSLFEKRGWQGVVSNSLLNHLLLIISLVIAGLTGCVSVEIERVQKLPLVSVTHPLKISFWIGFSVGFVLSNILFNVITSSVKSVVLCFAGSPDAFQENHPDCSRVMRAAWKKSWPGLVDFVDLENSNKGRSPTVSGRKFKRESLESLYV